MDRLIYIDPTAKIGYGVMYEVENCRKVVIEKDVVIKSGAIIYGGCHLKEGCLIGHNTVLMPDTIVGPYTYIGGLVNCEGGVTIGANCGINAQSHLTKGTIIEDQVFFGPMVCTSNDWEMNYHREGHGLDLKGPIIKYGVRIGCMATILPGIIVGRNALIGASAIVTKDVPDNEIWYGIPASCRGIVPEKKRIQ